MLQHALSLCDCAEESSFSVAETSKQRAVTLPHFIRGFSASAIYVRIKSLQVSCICCSFLKNCFTDWYVLPI